MSILLLIIICVCSFFFFFFFNDTATTEIYTLSLHDALPIWHGVLAGVELRAGGLFRGQHCAAAGGRRIIRSEEHTSELQSRPHLVCRLLLEKKKTNSLPVTPSTCQFR